MVEKGTQIWIQKEEKIVQWFTVKKKVKTWRKFETYYLMEINAVAFVQARNLLIMIQVWQTFWTKVIVKKKN